ncbi:trehalose-phosphatase [Streptomyces sp. AJS327]|uniref:trehalose-phosphatase n=1 Tax=Streptomyces sp. AJS327 TaxID=2545265 RepID=UPI0015DE9372|nr:trehalose-phosphatase [Streptomyces sp. AJS327]MBA0053897.1 trehalose-phosphatase [Streptomyces sp. AJS327]
MGSSLPVPATSDGRAGLDAILAAPHRAVVALDFDGTLAPIVSDPEQARPHPEVLPALARLAPALGALAVVTGRSARTAVRYGGFAGVPGLERLTVLGAYGAERWSAATGRFEAPPPPPGVAAVRAELPRLLAESGAPDGVWTEDKGRAVAVHTRRAADPAATLALLRAPLTELAEQHQLRVEPGRMVLELRPPGMDKGAALLAFLREVGAGEGAPPPDRPGAFPAAPPVLYAGDDLGDLAAFAAVRERRAEGGPGLLVCSGSAEVTELADRADLVVDGPPGVARLLGALATALS